MMALAHSSERGGEPRDEVRLQLVPGGARSAAAPVSPKERDDDGLPVVRRGTSIAITSGKGGVGKTFVTVNLGIALARRGLSVLIVDADLGLANVDTMLGLTPRATVRQVLAGECALADVLIDGPAGTRIVPAASGFEDVARLGGQRLYELLADLHLLAQGYDVALIDTAAGIAPAVLGATLLADRKVVVATPEPTALTDAYALLKVLATRYGALDADVIVNQARSRAEAARTFAHLARVTERFLGFTPRSLGHLPHDGEVVAAIRRQQPVLDLAPRTPVSLALEALAARLIAPNPAPHGADPDRTTRLLEARP